MYQLKLPRNVYYVTVSVRQESGSGLAGCFWLQVSPYTAVNLWAPSHLKAQRGESIPKPATKVVGRPQFLFGCWSDTLVPPYMNLFMSCLSILME